MYLLLLLLLLGAGVSIWRKGRREGRRALVLTGVLWLAVSLLLFPLLGVWGDLLWFEAVGYADRFWTMLWVRLGTLFAGVAIATGFAWVLVRPLGAGERRWVQAIVASAIGGAVWGAVSWNEVLLYLNQVKTGVVENVLGLDAGFYLFQLPLYDHLFWLFLWVGLVSLVAVLSASFHVTDEGFVRLRGTRDYPQARRHPLLVTGSALAFIAGAGCLLAVFHLLYSDWGVVEGAGWTDVHVRLPALLLIVVLFVVLGVALLLPAVQDRWRNWLVARVVQAPVHLVARRRDRWRRRLLATGLMQAPEVAAIVVGWCLVGAVWLVAMGFMPTLVQWLVVEPNEITLERPYLEQNIAFTRRAFGLDRVEDRQFEASDEFTREMMERSQHVLSEVRLWDWRALDAVYKQFQEIRLYYEFFNVDMDRYKIGDRYRQVMISAREMAQRNLPPNSQTFINQRFKYTHGYGLTLSTVSDFTKDGRPNLLVKDIPPQSELPELRVDYPQIYYGELTDTPAVVNSREEEFDYPSGDQNVYTRYAGKGGVVLSSFWRKFVFGWKFDGTRFLLSNYPTEASRIMFHRQIRDRVGTLAPFIAWDTDPYIVLLDGRLYWIVDGYTHSTYYPYSEAFSSEEDIEYREARRARTLVSRVAPFLDGENYARNAVKAVVDAFDGSVQFYLFDPGDALIQAWSRAFPGLFRGRAEMPAGLVAHVRYPESYLLAQGLMYAKYHMADPAVFYNQEDLWIRATEKYYAEVQPVEPYYVMWELPDSKKTEFVAVLPFTPKSRQVLIGWIAAMCDGENYGRLLAYKFPKERRVLGPQQVETKIDQHPVLAGQLTIWDQKGSSVIRGNVLAIPIGESLIYVEPIYLRADTAAYPELRLVVVMRGDDLSYGKTFQEALENLFTGNTGGIEGAGAIDGLNVTSEAHGSGLAVEANRSFGRYLELQGDQRFEEAARELRNLQQLLERMAREEQPAAERQGEWDQPR